MVERSQQRITQTNNSEAASKYTASLVKNNVTKDMFLSGSGNAYISSMQLENPERESKKKIIPANILVSFINFMKRVVEVLLPLGNMVYAYPVYAIKVRSWMDYFLGRKVVDSILGSNGVFKLVLLLEKVSF